ncbi:MAG: hypothetical protein J3K34DRAFT_400599 [Monoraphidium minutum]|nr:MAG: hypothetical protein J3K34DRAFT_400599 [Monoraphidium minutum]
MGCCRAGGGQPLSTAQASRPSLRNKRGNRTLKIAPAQAAWRKGGAGTARPTPGGRGPRRAPHRPRARGAGARNYGRHAVRRVRPRPARAAWGRRQRQLIRRGTTEAHKQGWLRRPVPRRLGGWRRCVRLIPARGRVVGPVAAASSQKHKKKGGPHGGRRGARCCCGRAPPLACGPPESHA